MLNIPLLRQVQQSIADETKPFSMGSWAHCIAGHTLQAIGASTVITFDFDGLRAERTATRALGLNEFQASWLFHRPTTRQEAIQSINNLIAEEKIQQVAGAAQWIRLDSRLALERINAITAAAMGVGSTGTTGTSRMLAPGDCVPLTLAPRCAASSALASPAQGQAEEEEEELVGAI